jgi:hypothetical protein
MFVWEQFAELQDPPTAQGGKEGREKVEIRSERIDSVVSPEYEIGVMLNEMDSRREKKRRQPRLISMIWACLKVSSDSQH